MAKNLSIFMFFIVVLTIIITAGIVLNSIFSSDTNIDMFIVWLIFMSEGLKKLLTSGWNSGFALIGSLMLFIWFAYFAIRIFSSKIDIELDNTTKISWSDKKEQIFQKYGNVFWKVGLTFWALSLSMDFLAVGIPTAKQSAVIYVVPKMMNNVDMQEIPPNLAKLVNEGLKEMIESVKGEVADVAKDAGVVAKDVAKDAVQEASNKVKEKIKE